ncbi:MAG: septum formation protein Maf [Saprospiraceae bacterium]|jgi:septum formation protein|nr:septum formation protein Maf [Saprospiraceae bacterium]MCA0332382.1 Maf family protein [Bacteroidota bacterium]HQW96660.1 Maf family protein [Saprospiraceae bacterium]
MEDLRNFHKFRLFLASKSPRRIQLMKEAGYMFEVLSNDVEEDYPIGLPIVDVPEFIANNKAKGAKWALKDEQSIVIGADSVVILNEGIIGKPKDASDAKHILKKLSGQTHRVVTGVALMSLSKTITFSETAEVSFSILTDTEIDYYIEHFNPMDKAGAYGIQDWIGLCRVQSIRGTFSNIMGLPMARLYEELMKF